MPQVSEAETILPPPEKQDPLESQFFQNDKALVSSKPEMVKEKIENDPPPDKDKPLASAATPPQQHVKKETGAETQTTQAEVKSKKRETVEQLAPMQLPEIRPNLLTEEQVDDIRPN